MCQNMILKINLKLDCLNSNYLMWKGSSIYIVYKDFKFYIKIKLKFWNKNNLKKKM